MIESGQAKLTASSHVKLRHTCSLERSLTVGKTKGKRARGRQRGKIWDELGRWTGGGNGIDLIVKNVRTERRGGTWSPTPTVTASHDDYDFLGRNVSSIR